MSSRLNRRQFLKRSGAAALALSAAPFLPAAAGPIGLDRQAVVRRHNPVFDHFDPFSSLSLGNGEFAFTADITGLQTFPAECEQDFPLCTASHWGWHSSPIPEGLRREDFRFTDYDTCGRPVGYATEAKGQEPLFYWMRQNPHRLHLGRIGLALTRFDGTTAKPADLSRMRQSLDLWTGLLESRFEFEGQPVRVQTCCHWPLDLLAVRVESPLLRSGRLRVLLAFPYGSPELSMADWTHPERHVTTLACPDKSRASFTRKLDNDTYHVSLGWSDNGSLKPSGPHQFLLGAAGGDSLELSCLFSPKLFGAALPTVAETQQASREHWRDFWSRGGAIDLSASSDPRAALLEHRIVLSLYQTAVHCAGSLPSAETGLLSNSWHGKFHLEMHWWHSVHFAAWGRHDLFEKSLGIYQCILPLARETAKRQGYAGARWPKMIGPDGHDSPSPVGPLLIWQQPHPIYYAELCYHAQPTLSTLERWQEIVFATAEFMASYAVLERARDQFVLGPPLKTVSENTEQRTTRNPCFELAYWRFGLRTAQDWRERLSLPREPRWDEVLNKLAPLPEANGLYLLQEGMEDTYTRWNWEHPALLGALGMQPGDGVNPLTMQRTVRRVMETWQWERSWGWDFPLAAMAAARCDEPELAVQALLLNVPKNRYLPNGRNYQREKLAAYLPGNGGLLSAVAMMAAGWTGGPTRPAPGFPLDGRWSVRSEGLRQWI